MFGHIKLDRKILNWEWYQDANTCRLFIHLLLIANHKEGKWQGQNVGRGQSITGLKSLKKATGLTIQQIRTSISKLKITGEITIKTTNKNSTITICKYDTYQSVKENNNKQNNTVITNEQQTSNKRATTNNNDNNKKNDNNIDFEDFWNLYEKKVGDKGKLKKKWDSLTDVQQKQAMQHIPKYKIAQPDKQFRKNPETYLNNKSFNDEVVGMPPEAKIIELQPRMEGVAPEYAHLGKTAHELAIMAGNGEIEF